MQVSFFRLWCQWSFALSGFTAVFWWWGFVSDGSVPLVNGVSRWWDIAFPPVMLASLFFGFWSAEKIDQLFEAPALGLYLWASVLSCVAATVVVLLSGILRALPFLLVGYVVWGIGAFVVCLIMRIVREFRAGNMPDKGFRD